MALPTYRENDTRTQQAVSERSVFNAMSWSDLLIPAGELIIGALLAASVLLIVDGSYTLILLTILVSTFALVRAYLRTEGASVGRSPWFAVFAAALISLLILDLPPEVQVLTTMMAIGAGAEFMRLSLRDARERNRIEKLAALLLFEGRLGSNNYYDQKLNFCRTLLALSHRTNHPLSILALRWTNPPASANPAEQSSPQILNGVDQHLRRFEIITTIEKSGRSSDIVLVDEDENLIFIVCPYTPPRGALQLASRLSVQVHEEANSTLNHAMASYPEDGYDFEEIMSASIRRMGKAGANANGSDLRACLPSLPTQTKKPTQPAAPSLTRLHL